MADKKKNTPKQGEVVLQPKDVVIRVGAANVKDG